MRNFLIFCRKGDDIMLYKNIDLVKENDRLADDVFNTNECLLVCKGTILTQKWISLLKKNGINGVNIDDLSDKQVVISGNEKKDIIKNLKNFNFEAAISSAKMIVDKIKNNPDLNEYFDLKTFDNYTYEHSISVAIYAVLMGFASGFKEQEIVNLAIAGIFHDIGKRFIDTDILYKPGKLSDLEFHKIKQHPAGGYHLVKDCSLLSATVKATVLQHHENEDGSGYPKGLKGDEIYKFAKIIHIVDVYDALISKRPYKDALPVAKAVEFIESKKGTMFDPYYTEIFRKTFPVYQEGEMISLGREKTAFVVSNPENSLNPIIRLENGEVRHLKDVA